LPQAREAAACPGAGAEDFLEGGVELPPAPVDCSRLSSDAVAAPPTPGSIRPLASLFDSDVGLLQELWPTSGAGPRALFLDYDGTLRELEGRPDLATPTQEVRELLAAMDARQDLVPHLISGRDARFLETHFGHFSRLTLIAEHGFQVRRPGSTEWEFCDPAQCTGCSEENDAWRAAIRAKMEALVQANPGSLVEEKASSLVWHYREVTDANRAEEAAASALERMQLAAGRDQPGQDVRISQGLYTIEASNRTVRKGPVMRRFCEDKALFGQPFLAVFVAGDDASDESMFDMAPPDFLTVKVGLAPTRARFRADSPSQLRSFLWRLLRLTQD